MPGILELAACSSNAAPSATSELLREGAHQLALPLGDDADGRYEVIKILMQLLAAGESITLLMDALKQNSNNSSSDFYQPLVARMVSLAYYRDEDEFDEVPVFLVEAAKAATQTWAPAKLKLLDPLRQEPKVDYMI
ncbi:hypothetical protein [Curtobacterium sp. RRHDQ10]|uniref:hypothetical protein n=1 Tax=Curtobacterium phyllosphaerae TaxID=3413379 RepID=UPI003BEFB7BB